MPAIHGVANGAMVVRDASFMKPSFEDFNTVLCTEVASSISLGHILSRTATQHPLDWFIGLSSVVVSQESRPGGILGRILFYQSPRQSATLPWPRRLRRRR